MNVSILIKSFSYLVDNFKTLVSVSLWISQELDQINYKRSKLKNALEKHDLEIIELLMSRNKSSRMIDNYLSTYPNHKDIVKLLILNGANPRVKDNELLYKICELNDHEFLQLLIKTNVRLPKQLLIHAVKHRSLDVLKILIAEGFKLSNELSLIAAQKGFFEIVAYLLQKGFAHEQVLWYACEHNKKDLVRRLLESDIPMKVDFSLTNNIIQNTDLLKLLLTHEKSKIEFSYGYLMKVCIRNNNFDIIKIIFDPLVTLINYNCLMKSVKYRNMDIVRFFVDKKQYNDIIIEYSIQIAYDNDDQQMVDFLKMI